MKSKGHFYYLPIVFIAALMLLMNTSAFAQLEGGTVDPITIPKFVIPLVIPPVMDSNGGPNNYDIAVRQFQQQILPGGIWNILNGRTDGYLPTTVWSYGPASDPTPVVAPDPASQFNYPAYTFETKSNVPVSVRWINELVATPDDCFKHDGTLRNNADPASCNYLPHLLPVDRTLHWANVEKLKCKDGDFHTDCSPDPTYNENAEILQDPYTGPVPMVVHVHGAHVDPHSDGYPEAWWLPAANNIDPTYATTGHLFDDAYGQVIGSNSGYVDYVYRQDQPATTLWYHDHSLGMTRLNVYAGPAGFWLVRKGMYDGAMNANGGKGILPGPEPKAKQGVLDLNIPGRTVRNGIREIPIVIQDRAFNWIDANGDPVDEGDQDAVGTGLFYPDNRAFFEGLDPEDLPIPLVPDSDSDIAPIWNPEAFFNVMVVNGVSWPKLEVAPALYRLRFLNGCNSRFLWLKFQTLDEDDEPVEEPEEQVEVWQIGAEQGFLPAPVSLNSDLDSTEDGTAQILMALAERADVIVDFRGLEDGTVVELRNIGPDEPFGGGLPCEEEENPEITGCFEPADPSTTGKVMRFVVNEALNGYGMTDPLLPNGKLNPQAATDPMNLVLNAELGLGEKTVTRKVSLNEESSTSICAIFNDDGSIEWLDEVEPGPGFEDNCEDAGGEPFGPKEALVGVVDSPGGVPEGVPLHWTDTSGRSTPVEITLQNGYSEDIYVTENPIVGDTEEWEIYNFTADAHPIHLHLVRFMVLGREVIGDPSATSAAGSNAPMPWETGYKDTVIAYPDEITTVKALFDIEGLYVWHCHIVEHEDNEMMRPYVVSAP